MNYIISANIIALTAAILMVYSGIIKKKSKILFIQTIQCGLSIISNILLGGISGAIINGVSCIRNILFYKNKLNTFIKIIISIITIIITIKFNNLKFIGLLPLISTLSYLWLMNTKNIIRFKLLIMFTMILWAIYDFSIKSYTSTIFDIGTFITNFISIIQIKYREK